MAALNQPGESTYEMSIADDRVGFAGGERPGHFGLRSMRERAALVGGTLEMESSPARGSRLTARLPRTTPG